MTQSNRIERITETLTKAFSPRLLEVIDDSHKHIGHAGAASGAGHFTIVIAADIFNDKKNIESHRMIYDALADLMIKEIHALSIKIKKT